MKALLGAGFAAALIGLAIICPDHVWDQAQAATEIPEEVHAEVNRQLNLFVEVMDGDRPEVEEALSE